MKRSVVALKKGSEHYIVPKFSNCLLEYFKKDVNSAKVSWSLQNGLLILEENENGYELRHSPQCPIKLQSQSDALTLSDDNVSITLATSVVVVSSDNHVLLTKRSQNMRSSPNVWVPPGGHVENNESIIDTGIREVHEETGLDISNGKFEILGLWESVYPLLLGIGPPKSHVLVVYINVLLNESHKELIKKIIPNKHEVSSYCWLSKSALLGLYDYDMPQHNGKQYVIENEQITERELDYSSMFNKWLWRQAEPYSGVNFCLRKWLQKNINGDRSSKF